MTSSTGTLRRYSSTAVAVPGEARESTGLKLGDVLQKATGADSFRTDVPERIGVLVKLNGAESTQRISLQRRGDELVLVTWPGELKDQAQGFYGSGRAGRVLGLIDSNEEWNARSDFHLGFHTANKISQRFHPGEATEIHQYVERWSGPDADTPRAWKRDRVDDELWDWMLERGLVSERDMPAFEVYLSQLLNRDAHVRSGIELNRTWSWDQAVALDEAGDLVGEVREAIRTMLDTLGEPMVPALRS